LKGKGIELKVLIELVLIDFGRGVVKGKVEEEVGFWWDARPLAALKREACRVATRLSKLTD